MKRIKLMLLSLSILAVVGGALAFTVKTSPLYCTANTVLVNNVTTCPVFCPDEGKIQIGAGTDYICTTTTSQDPEDPCPNTLGCTSTNPGFKVE
jgi:hypothetical protein